MTVNAFSDAVEYDLTFRRRGTSVAVTEIYPSAREALDAAIKYVEDGASFYSLLEVHVSTRSKVILLEEPISGDV
jgi:hypothetical protein